MLGDLRRPSLVRRLILLAAGWSLAVLVITGLVLTSQFRQSALNRLDLSVAELVERVYAFAEVRPGGAVTPRVEPDQHTERGYSGRYWQILEVDPSGNIRELAPPCADPVAECRTRSRSLADLTLKGPPGGAAQLSATPGKPVAYDLKGPLGQSLRAAALISELPGRPGPVVFVAAEDRGPMEQEAGRFATTVAVALVLLGFGLIVAVFFQVRVGLHPLFELRREVAAVRTGKADQVVGAYPVELSPLAEELNALVAHNQEVVERQRTHVGNLAHALKTPLSVMLAEAQARPGPLAQVVTRQAETMHSQVDHHLRRARAAARAQGQRERTLVAPVIEELARTLERIFRDRRVAVDWRADEILCFQGERQDLLEIIGNVMENACKWSAGRVRVVAEAVSAETMKLVVEDDGPGLPPERRAEVLKRGARLDEKTPGSGLGLSIVDELARAYGGALELGESDLGGLRVEITLPQAEG